MPNFSISVLPSSSLIGTGSSIVPISNPAIQIPPPPAGGSSTVTLTAGTTVTLGAVTTSSGMSWSSPNVSITGAFSSGTVTIPFTRANGGSGTTILTIQQSTGTAAATTTSVTVNADGTCLVTNMPQGVSLSQGVTTLVTGIPSGGQVEVLNPVFFVQSAGPTFAFANGSNVTSVGTPSYPANSGLSGTNPVTVSSWSQLDDTQITVPFTSGASNDGNALVTVAQSATSGTSSGPTSMNVNSDQSVLVTQLGTNVTFMGINLQYQTTQAGTYGFTLAGSGLTLDPSFISNLQQSNNTISFTNTNTANQPDQIAFTIATSAGILDPTIVNNPDT